MAFDSYGSSNQENQTARKPSGGVKNASQRSTSNLRTPLSNVSSSRKPTADPTDARAKNGSRKKFEDEGPSEQYDDIPENMYRPDKEDLAGWIHREKLAKIENEELQAAGINLAKARSKSKDPAASRTRDRSRDPRDVAAAAREEKRLKASTPVNDEPEDATQADWDPRTPEEVADEDAASQMYASPSLRKSGSKIPVMTSSPTPIPTDRYERDTPMPRKRTLSGSIAPEDTLAAVRSKTGHHDPNTPGSHPDSPNKQRKGSIGNVRGIADSKTPSGQRKVSAQTPPNSYNNRPVTRGNEAERPRSSSNAPEGDPPWLSMMYKPDPRLPPDQQIIPTIAKKQAQEMWEANGTVPSTYDRNFQALQIYGSNGLPQQALPPEQQQKEAEAPQPLPEDHDLVQNSGDTDAWPLRPIPPPKPDVNVSRPPTSGGTGGYSTMPKVTGPPVGLAPSPKFDSGSPASSRAHTPVDGAGMTQHQTIGIPSRLQQQPLTNDQEEKLQKKGCCCIVM